MSKDAVFMMKLEPDLRNIFMEGVEAAHRPALQIVRDFARGFAQRQREAQGYDDFLRQKVETARLSLRAGHGRFNEEVEADFAVRRAELRRPIGEVGV